jgi:hypothetical protein
MPQLKGVPRGLKPFHSLGLYCVAQAVPFQGMAAIGGFGDVGLVCGG